MNSGKDLLGEVAQRTRINSEHETGVDFFVDLDVIDHETVARIIRTQQEALDALDAKRAAQTFVYPAFAAAIAGRPR